MFIISFHAKFYNPTSSDSLIIIKRKVKNILAWPPWSYFTFCQNISLLTVVYFFKICGQALFQN